MVTIVSFYHLSQSFTNDIIKRQFDLIIFTCIGLSVILGAISFVFACIFGGEGAVNTSDKNNKHVRGLNILYPESDENYKSMSAD